jgi:hypothetical protein
MSTICVLKIANAESNLGKPGPKRSSGCRPISLLVFLQAENRKLQKIAAQLERDTTALREALQRG